MQVFIIGPTDKRGFLMSMYGVNKVSVNCFVKVFFPAILMGLMPYCPNRRISRFLLVYSLAFHILHRCFYIYVLTRYIGQYSDMDFVLMSLICTNCIFKTSCIVSHLFSIIRGREKFLSIVDVCLNEDFTRNRFRFITLAGVFVLPIPLIARQVVDTGWVSMMYCIGGIVDIVSIFLIAMQYCTLLEIATKRFIATKFSLHMQLNEIENATDMHNNILELTKKIHSIYGRTILVEVCYLGFDFIVAFYDAIQSVRVHQLYTWGVSTFFCSIGYILTIYILCNACETVMRMAEKFNAELFRLMRENKELCKNEKLQLYVTMKQTVNFTACGFFTLGYPLVTSIIAAATTYLVILVQFSMPAAPAKT
uniref:Gustatory receptor n=1 Tax=Cyrtorhinus lividipennis TaxID=1032904 RepID=A0A346TI30_9HEMI|nr:gustatory receptor 1 [Cyrtorhinus lividipennis]